MSDTPRTDDQIGHAGSTMTMVRIDFARQLEREVRKAEKERDQWRAMAQELAVELDETRKGYNVNHPCYSLSRFNQLNQ